MTVLTVPVWISRLGALEQESLNQLNFYFICTAQDHENWNLLFEVGEKTDFPFSPYKFMYFNLKYYIDFETSTSTNVGLMKNPSDCSIM